MEYKEYKISIKAPREKVWKTLWDDATYRQWTSVFSEGSMAKTDWKEGSKVLFLDGKGSGMVSTIVENKANEFMSIKHLGIVKNGVEDTTSPEVAGWAGAMENYTLTNKDGNTDVLVEMSSKGIPAEFVEYFDNTWPKALDKLKEISEKN